MKVHTVRRVGLFPLSLVLLLIAATQVFHLGIPATVTRAATAAQVYPVMNTSETLPDGVWFRTTPRTWDTDRVTGHGVYAGDRVQLTCYASGDAVGPYANRIWYYVSNLTRPTVPKINTLNVGFLNAHYINDGKLANQVDAGVPACSTPTGAAYPYPYSNNIWSGYVASGKQFSDVKASWKVSAITCQRGQTSHVYTWVGLGGVGAPLEQIGTEFGCYNGQPAYYAWWQTLPEQSKIQPIPNSQHYTSLSIGATITAEVQYKGSGGAYHLSIAENGKSLFSQYVHGKTDASAYNSADFIVEHPQGPQFSQYQPITF